MPQPKYLSHQVALHITTHHNSTKVLFEVPHAYYLINVNPGVNTVQEVIFTCIILNVDKKMTIRTDFFEHMSDNQRRMEESNKRAFYILLASSYFFRRRRRILELTLSIHLSPTLRACPPTPEKLLPIFRHPIQWRFCPTVWALYLAPCKITHHDDRNDCNNTSNNTSNNTWNICYGIHLFTLLVLAALGSTCFVSVGDFCFPRWEKYV